jgi:putative endonuclease
VPPEPLGRWGERLAARHLERAGWAVLARNYRLGRKEIDLVARRGGVVAFVEVKTRRGTAFGDPLESVTPRKRREIAEVAAGWIQRFGEPGLAYRFDAVAIRHAGGGRAEVRHVEDAWRL